MGDEEEVTRDVDPEWLASVLDPPLGDIEPHFMDDEPEVGFPPDDMTTGDVTIANEDLLAHVREAVRSARDPQPTPDPRPSTPPEPQPAPASASSDRWTPPPRLKPAQTPAPPAMLIEPSRSPSRLDVRVVIAIVVAVVAGILLGVAVFGGDDGDSPAPTDSTTVEATTTTSTP